VAENIEANYCGGNDMLLSKMKSTTFSLGVFKRPDGENFEISARLYECPSEYDYWLTIYDAVHKDWKQMHFTLFMPKKIAASAEVAKTIVRGDALEQVKSNLLQAEPGSRAFTVPLQTGGA
jgi:hypothetical protein